MTISKCSTVCVTLWLLSLFKSISPHPVNASDDKGTLVKNIELAFSRNYEFFKIKFSLIRKIKYLGCSAPTQGVACDKRPCGRYVSLCCDVVEVIIPVFAIPNINIPHHRRLGWQRSGKVQQIIPNMVGCLVGNLQKNTSLSKYRPSCPWCPSISPLKDYKITLREEERGKEIPGP